MALHCSPLSLIWSIPVVVKNQQPNLSRCGKTAYRNFTNCNKNLFNLLFCSVFLTPLLLSFCWICVPLVPTPPAFPSYILIPLFFELSLTLSSKQTVYELNWGLAINLNKKKAQPFSVQGEMASTALESLMVPSFLSTSTEGEAAKDSCLISP